MSIVKDIIIETAKRMPENITFESAAYEILNVGTTFEELRSSKEGRSIPIEELFDIIIQEGESDDERILRRAKEAEKVYRDGDVKIGNFEDFWKDMND